MISAAEYWNDRVETHHAQSIRAENELPKTEEEDFWAPMVASFKDDPRRADDTVLNRLSRDLTARTTVLDVGGGAGRFALPLALKSRHVTVVEPSVSMLAGLDEGMKEAGIDNVSIVQQDWEDAQVEPSDVLVCAHVAYGVSDIEPFLRKLDSNATERVMLISFTDSPMSGMTDFWKRIHGEDRINLPALPELMNVLWEMDIYPDVEMVQTSGPRSADDMESALKMLRRFIYVEPGTEKDKRLQETAKELLIETSDGLVVQGAKLRRQALVTWKPE